MLSVGRASIKSVDALADLWLNRSMLISQIINPADLVSLTPRQQDVLNTLVASEMLASPTIRAELAKKANAGLKALKAQSAAKKAVTK